MWIVTNTLHVPPAAAGHVVEAFRSSPPDMQAFEGFLGVEPWRHRGGSLLVITH